MTKQEITAEIVQYSKSNDFKKIVIDEVIKKAVSSHELEKVVMQITTNMLIQLFKALWTKRDFWKNSLSNKSN